MELHEEQQGDITVVAAIGRIDSTTAKGFGERLTDLIRSGSRQVIIDLSEVAYMSSAGFRSLLVAGKLIDDSNGQLCLCGLSGEIQRLFDLSGFTDLFSICASRDESIAQIASPD
jgi:anti-anti-sigma factor